MQNGGKKKKKEGKRKETRKERERGTTKHRIRGRRIIDESSTNKRNQRDEVHQDLHARARAQQTRVSYVVHIHAYIRTWKKHDKTTRRRFLESNAREFIIFPMIRVIRTDSL